MTKMVTVQAQQKWEYRIVNKHTENTLLIELNESGKAGWELISAGFNKDLKGVWTWTAFMKRPWTGQVGAPGAQPEAEAGAPTTQSASPENHNPQGFDLSGDTFDVKAP